MRGTSVAQIDMQGKISTVYTASDTMTALYMLGQTVLLF